MGKRTRYEPGTFSWVDLATTDPTAAKAFYQALFGWDAVDTPIGDGGTYTMLRIGGDDVAGLSELDAGRRAQGVPSHWSNYVSVDDADATAARARELGGTVLGETFDVLDSGRMAVIQDPTGGVLAAWQPRSHIGAGVVNEPGSLTWNELNTGNPEPAIAFYRDLFGWDVEPAEEDGKLVYATIKNGGRTNGGIMPHTGEQAAMPPAWVPYFVVESADAASARVKELGGSVLAEPFEPMPGNRVAVVSDPQGAVFAVFSGETDD